MIWTVSQEVRERLRQAEKVPLGRPADPGGRAVLDREAIEALLPHRHPFLFVNQVMGIDLERGSIVARYDLAHAHEILAGHFPNRPVLPGVLQVEAIGQAGSILYLVRAGGGRPAITATHLLGARFLRPVSPGGHLEIHATLIEDGLFLTIVGQCLHDGAICSVAAVNTLFS